MCLCICLPPPFKLSGPKRPILAARAASFTPPPLLLTHVSGSIVNVNDNFETGLLPTTSTGLDALDSTASYFNRLKTSTLPLDDFKDGSSSDDDSVQSADGLPFGNTAPSTSGSLFLTCYHLPVHLWRNSDGTWSGKWTHSLIAKTEGSVADAVPTYWIGGVRRSKGMSERDEEEIAKCLKTM